MGAENVGDLFLVRRAVKHVALMPVGDAQHLGAIIVIAARFLPQLGRLDGRHHDFNGAGAVLLLADNLRDPVENLLAKRQPGIILAETHGNGPCVPVCERTVGDSGSERRANLR